MKELYVLSIGYEPDTAPTVHILAYVKGLAENGVYVTMFFLRPSKDREKCRDRIHNVEFVYLWEDIHSRCKRLKQLVPLLRFYSAMKPTIPVLVTGCPNELVFLRLKKNIRLFHERTENPYRVKAMFNKLYLKSLSKLDGVIVITSSLRNLFIEEFKVKPENIIVANMVVDENRFTKLDDIKPSHTISYCGTISEWKDGVSFLIKAFSIVHRKHPDYYLKLMGGFENEETRNKLLNLVNIEKITSYVVFTGVVNSSEMPLRLKEAEILALARPRQKEKAFGFATKIGEYLMTERPVVMTDVGDVKYYIQSGKEAVYAKPNDVADFADKLLWVIEHPKEASVIGRNGKKAAIREFNYLKESKKIIDFIFG